MDLDEVVVDGKFGFLVCCDRELLISFWRELLFCLFLAVNAGRSLGACHLLQYYLTAVVGGIQSDIIDGGGCARTGDLDAQVLLMLPQNAGCGVKQELVTNPSW